MIRAAVRGTAQLWRDIDLFRAAARLSALATIFFTAAACNGAITVDAPSPTPSPTVTAVAAAPEPTAADLGPPPTSTPQTEATATPAKVPRVTPTLSLNEEQRTAIARGTPLPTRVIPTRESVRPTSTSVGRRPTPTSIRRRPTATPIPGRATPTPLVRRTPTPIVRPTVRPTAIPVRPTAVPTRVLTPPPLGVSDTRLRGGITSAGGWITTGSVSIYYAIEDLGGSRVSGGVTISSGLEAIRRSAGN